MCILKSHLYFVSLHFFFCLELILFFKLILGAFYVLAPFLAFCCHNKVQQINTVREEGLSWLTVSEASVLGQLVPLLLGQCRDSTSWQECVVELSCSLCGWQKAKREEGPGSQCPPMSPSAPVSWLSCWALPPKGSTNSL